MNGLFKKLLFSAIFSSIVCHVSAQRTMLSGKVINKETLQPILGATITVADIGTATDSTGIFNLSKIKPGNYLLTVSAVNYDTERFYNIIVTTGNELFFNVELKPSIKKLDEIVVTSVKRTARAATLETPLSTQRMTTEEIKANPGGNFDISKVIQSLPGVGGGQQGGGFRNDIIIRGGAPNENVYYLDGIEIPVINHFQTQGSSGGPQGILNVSFIEDVKLSSSAFDAKYDNTMSSVFQFRQKTGNPNHLQGNFRLSATEIAATMEGPLNKTGQTTFLASARRSYLQYLFMALDLPIRPNYWDFQYKIDHRINNKTSLSFIGIGAIDEFSFAKIKNATPEKQYILNSNPITNQWNYTFGITLKKLLSNGYMNISLSRNTFNNQIERFEDNETKLAEQQTLRYQSKETETKIRWDVIRNNDGWKYSYGMTLQLSEYENNTYNVVRKLIKDSNGDTLQRAVIVNFNSPLKQFIRYGAYLQVGKRFFNNRLGISAGIRTDMNSFTTTGNDGIKTLSPRISTSYVLTDKWTINASAGRYFKLQPYTILGYAENGVQVNKDVNYQCSDHLALGLEYLPQNATRFTLEGFYKKYSGVPVSVRDGVSLANLGNDFTVLGNEKVKTNGTGRAYGFEFFAQQKLTNKFFGILSYTYYISEYAGSDGKLKASSWDNRHLLSITWGYKFPRNWELGLKFRLQGGAPFTPYDTTQSRLNYLSLGQGVLDYNRINSGRLTAFHNSDVRIDKKWNFKKITLDVFLDVNNWYVTKSIAPATYTFKRNEALNGFATTDGSPIRANGANAIPVYLSNNDPSVTPTIGCIVEF